jgi:hypothetical protein
MVALYAIAALHHLRNEGAASVYALRLAGEWPPGPWREARDRLTVALAGYLCDWLGLGLLIPPLAATMVCVRA